MMEVSLESTDSTVTCPDEAANILLGEKSHFPQMVKHTHTPTKTTMHIRVSLAILVGFQWDSNNLLVIRTAVEIISFSNST